MINKKVILLVLLLVLVPFIMGQQCLSSRSMWTNAMLGDIQMELNVFYTSQANDINALAGWVNANAEFQFQLLQVRQLWGEE
ncbi:hypothetical protein ACFLTK_03725 [Chloroflexota bacterium]